MTSYCLWAYLIFYPMVEVFYFILIYRSIKIFRKSGITKNSRLLPPRINFVGHFYERRTNLCKVFFTVNLRKNIRKTLSKNILVKHSYVKKIAYAKSYPNFRKKGQLYNTCTAVTSWKICNNNNFIYKATLQLVSLSSAFHWQYQARMVSSSYSNQQR